MYCLISKKYSSTKRGAFTTSERFEKDYPKYISSKDIDSIDDLSEIRDKYTRLIFTTQTPHQYNGKLTIVNQQSSDIIYIRKELNPLCWNNSCTNGFSCYLESPIKNFIPQITKSDFKCNPSKKSITLGYYYRPGITPDSCYKFFMLLKNLKFKIKLMTFGNYFNLSLINFPNNVEEHEHTFDNKYFFSKITHYIHFKSSQFVDPFPNALLEAVESGAQIVIPDSGRNFKDGIDDIQSCIKYHNKLNLDKIYDNSNTILKADNFKNFYIRLFHNNYNYTVKKDKYSSLREWCEGEL